MKIRPALSVIITIFLFPAVCLSQTPDERVLMSVAGHEVEAGEFVRMYKKNTGQENNPGFDSYLIQFIEFKLKVAEAITEGYDTTYSFKNELAGYRSQLAGNYLNDPTVKENLVRIGYNRSLTEIDASHILISCPPDATPSDTLKAFSKAMFVRKKITDGESFEKAAVDFSDDKSARLNGGNLGFFTAFQMVTPFEDAAYNLGQRELSMPVRTQFGYHIIRVNNRRQSQGKVKVAHIMKAVAPGSDSGIVRKAEEEIFKIYRSAIEGKSFRILASTYSDDRNSASSGGELEWFGTGEVIKEFSETAFSLTDTGSISAPFRTGYGFHIIKLLGRKKPGTFEESRSAIENRLNASYINTLSRNSVISKLKKEYNFRVNNDLIRWFEKNTDTLIMKGSKYNRNKIPPGNVYSFSDKILSAQEFASVIEKEWYTISSGSPQQFIGRLLETTSGNHILRYEESLLETKYPDFRYLVGEFHDGILLFDITSRKIWNKVQNDSAGLRDYYLKHRHEHLTNPVAEGKLFILKIPGAEKKLFSSWKKYSGIKEGNKLMLSHFNRKNNTLLTITEGKWQKGTAPLPDNLELTQGVHPFTIDRYPALLEVTHLAGPEPMPFEDVSGEMISGYQEMLMNEWIRQLKEKYPVKIDNIVLAEIRKKLENE